MPKIAMIGAGSVVFTKNLLGDILAFPELAQSHIALHDIDPMRLEAGERMARWTAGQLGASPYISASLDRRAVLDGADYVINMIQVGGHRATMIDFDIPKQYGLRQTIGDTLGIGGVFRSLRTIPVLLDICRDMVELCPDAWLLNYTNPMAMLTWAVTRATPVKVVGLCHSVQSTVRRLATYADVPLYELEYDSAGINHMAWLTRLTWNGADVYPRLREAMNHRYIFAKDKVRFEIMRHFGYFVTESSEHMSEYVPYFIKSPTEVERLDIPLDEYPRRSLGNTHEFEYTLSKLQSGGKFEIKRSEEYASLIIHSMETDTPRHIYGNVENRGLITNLPEGCCVEVRCDLDWRGLHPVPYGELPPQLAALNRTNINVQELTVRAAIEGCRDHVYHAAYLDPHTAASLTLPQIKAMVDDLIAAHGDALPKGV
jgi:alpha-galactosidase